MKKIYAKILSVLLAVLVTASLFTGCGAKQQEAVTGTQSAEETAQEADTQASTDIYPLNTDVTLKYWVQMQAAVSKSVSKFGDTPFAKELTKETGIKVEYINPPMGQEKDTFNIMIASNNLPDIIEYNWFNNYPGGPEKAIQDGIIIKLNDIQDKYAPNLMKVYSDNPDIAKAAKTDSGSYFQFPAINTSKMDKSTYGLIMRADWLKDLGLDAPTTIDEWYNVLKAFKEKKGAVSPLTFSLDKNPGVNGNFSTGELIGAFNVQNGFYLVEGKTVYGPLQPGYKDFLTTMNKWYKEGLIDKNFATIDQKTIESTMLSGKAGATLGYCGGTLGKLITAAKATDPKFDLAGVAYPTLKKGEKAEYGVAGPDLVNIGGVITSQCKNPEIAARLLDYGFSEKGHLLFNFGIEGESYTMVDGKPTFTDLVKKNPDKLTMAEALGRYIRASYSGIMVKDEDYTKQYLAIPQQKAALENWMNTNGATHLIPKVSFTTDESMEMAKITNSLLTLNQELLNKFILGTEPISNYDKYVEQVKQLGVDKVLQTYDTAIQRYNSR